MELKNRFALITGSGRGIGRAIAIRLAREGATVIVNDLDQTSSDQTAADIRGMELEAFSYPKDVAVRENVFSLVKNIVERFGTIDILVNNVGIASRLLIEDMSPDVWDRFININLTTPFNMAKAVLPHMIEKKYGKIVFIGSIAASRISGNARPRIAVRAGIRPRTRTIRLEESLRSRIRLGSRLHRITTLRLG